MNFKSILKPDTSVMAAAATAGSVYAIYSSMAGSVSQAHASDANHPALETSRKKAGYASFILVSALFLITRDGNVGTIGYGSIVAMELAYRTAIMANPQTGKMQMPTNASYEPAGAQVIPMQSQASA